MFSKCLIYIQKYGILSFMRNTYIELQKKIFCITQNLLFKGEKQSYSQYCEDLFIIRYF